MANIAAPIYTPNVLVPLLSPDAGKVSVSFVGGATKLAILLDALSPDKRKEYSHLLNDFSVKVTSERGDVPHNISLSLGVSVTQTSLAFSSGDDTPLFVNQNNSAAQTLDLNIIERLVPPTAGSDVTVSLTGVKNDYHHSAPMKADNVKTGAGEKTVMFHHKPDISDELNQKLLLAVTVPLFSSCKGALLSKSEISSDAQGSSIASSAFETLDFLDADFGKGDMVCVVAPSPDLKVNYLDLLGTLIAAVKGKALMEELTSSSSKTGKVPCLHVSTVDLLRAKQYYWQIFNAVSKPTYLIVSSDADCQVTLEMTINKPLAHASLEKIIPAMITTLNASLHMLVDLPVELGETVVTHFSQDLVAGAHVVQQVLVDGKKIVLNLATDATKIITFASKAVEDAVGTVLTMGTQGVTAVGRVFSRFFHNTFGQNAPKKAPQAATVSS